MKTTIALSLALVALSPAGAQVFRPEGRNRAAPDGARHHQTSTHTHAPRGGDYIYRHAPTVRVGEGFGHGHGYLRHDYGRFYRGYGYGYYSPAYAYGYYPSYGDAYPYYGTSGYYGSGSAAGSGLLVGALAGGIIGNNSGEFRHNGWRGAAWGAGVGWLLGSIADANRRVGSYERAPAVVQQAPAAALVQPTAPAAPQPVTIINNYYGTPAPMSGANSLFGR